jgi:ketosteroid isomerase-like protein
MSGNLALVRSIYEAWGQGDFSSVAWAADDIEYVSVGGPDPGTWKGLAEMAQANRTFLSTWSDWRVEAEAFRELDEARVLVLTRRGGTGKRSRFPIWEPAANLIHLRGGKVARLVFYWDRDRALADLGLEEEAWGG